MGPICLGRKHSQIYPHMPAKFGHDRWRIASARLEIRQILRTALLYAQCTPTDWQSAVGAIANCRLRIGVSR